MKNFKNIKFLSFLFFVGLAVTSCVEDDDFSLPEINTVEPNIVANIDITAVKEIYGGFEPQQILAGDGSERPLYIEAYVVSSDETGNFFKQLIIQDQPENPTAGISISTEATDLYTKYEPGRKIYFRVDGLYVGEFAGLPTIGTQSGDEVGRIGIEDFNNRIFRSLETFELVPTIVTINQALNNDNLLNTLVQFQNVQFPDNLAGNTYGECGSTFGVNRNVEDCDNNIIIMRQSGFADFTCTLLPQGNGSLTAIVSAFNATKQLFIRDITDVDFTGERCEGEIIIIGDANLPFMEDFEAQASGTGELVNILGWTNVNVNGGARKYEVREFSSNKYAQASAFNSDENPFEVWLVTPGINLPASSTPKLKFETKDGFNNGTALTVSVSTDYAGDITSATWTNVNATISTGNTSDYGANFIPSGDIDLTAYAGQAVFVRFKYAGSSSGVTTTYQIDNVSVTD